MNLSIKFASEKGFNLGSIRPKVRGLSIIKELHNMGLSFLGDLNRTILVTASGNQAPKELKLKAGNDNITNFQTCASKLIKGFSDYRQSQGSYPESLIYEAESSDNKSKSFDVNKTAIFRGRAGSSKNTSDGIRFFQPQNELNIGSFKKRDNERKLIDGYKIYKLEQAKALLVHDIMDKQIKHSSIYSKDKTFIGSIANLDEINLNQAKLSDFKLDKGLLYDKKKLSLGEYDNKQKLSNGYIITQNGIEAIQEGKQTQKFIAFNDIAVEGEFSKPGLPVNGNEYLISSPFFSNLKSTWKEEDQSFIIKDTTKPFTGTVKVRLNPKKKMKSQKDFLQCLNEASIDIQGKVVIELDHPKARVEIVTNGDNTQAELVLGNTRQAFTDKHINDQTLKRLAFNPQAVEDLKEAANKIITPKLASKSKKTWHPSKTAALLIFLTVASIAYPQFLKSNLPTSSDQHKKVADFSSKDIIAKHIDNTLEEISTEKKLLSPDDLNRLNELKGQLKDDLLFSMSRPKERTIIHERKAYMGGFDRDNYIQHRFDSIKDELDKHGSDMKIRLLFAAKILKKFYNDEEIGGPSNNSAGIYISSHSQGNEAKQYIFSMVLTFLLAPLEYKSPSMDKAVRTLSHLIIEEFKDEALSKYIFPAISTGPMLVVPADAFKPSSERITVEDLKQRNNTTLAKIKKNALDKKQTEAMIKDCFALAEDIYSLRVKDQITYNHPLVRFWNRGLFAKYANIPNFENIYAIAMENTYLKDASDKGLAIDYLYLIANTSSTIKYQEDYNMVFGDDVKDLLLNKNMTAIKQTFIAKTRDWDNENYKRLIISDGYQELLSEAIDKLSTDDIVTLRETVNYYLEAILLDHSKERRSKLLNIITERASYETAKQCIVIFNYLVALKIARDSRLRQKLELTDKADLEHITQNFITPYIKD